MARLASCREATSACQCREIRMMKQTIAPGGYPGLAEYFLEGPGRILIPMVPAADSHCLTARFPRAPRPAKPVASRASFDALCGVRGGANV
jgi:hypothetical protein